MPPTAPTRACSAAGRPERDPAPACTAPAAASAQQLLRAAAERLGRPCTQLERSGRIEREVVAAADGADLLILARDGDRTHLGPRSLSPATRFVVDHAPCPVLLVWPETPPAIATIPPAPPAGRTSQIRSAEGTCGTAGILAPS